MLRELTARPDAPRSSAAQSCAVVFEKPNSLALQWIELPQPGADDVVVDVEWTGISTGTEKLLWQGDMPEFPGMGYPLVPGYETVGRIVDAGRNRLSLVGERVFVSGAACFGAIRGLFGGAASRLVVDADKVLPVVESSGEEATLLALAATAHHALHPQPGKAHLPDLIVGHGVLGRLLARLTIALGGSEPVVWETDPARRSSDGSYVVVDPVADERHDYRRIVDVSGDSRILDQLVARLARHGEIVLAGFYPDDLRFAFPPAFMRETTIRVAAEWRRDDLTAVNQLMSCGRLSLRELITHRCQAHEASTAYPLAFTEPGCLKMILDWREDV